MTAAGTDEVKLWRFDPQLGVSLVRTIDLDSSCSGIAFSSDSLKILAARDAAEDLTSPDLAIEVGEDWLLVGDFLLERNQ